MEKKRKLLTIGQFAAMHGINKKTLMWYDEIGLFHPAAFAVKVFMSISGNGVKYGQKRQAANHWPVCGHAWHQQENPYVV